MQSRLDEARRLIEGGETEAGLKIANEELDTDPQNLRAVIATTRAFLDLKRPGLAELAARRAVELSPNDPGLWGYLGLALNLSLQLDEAEAALLKALSLSPRDPVALEGLGIVYMNKGEPDKAIWFTNKALARNPDDSDLIENSSFAYLMKQDWKEGWWRYNKGVGRDPDRKERIYGTEGKWDGTKGQTVVAYGEQGLGDEISFASAIPDLMKDANVIIECDHRLEGLFKRSFDCPVYGTRYRNAEWVPNHKIDARIAFSQLMEFYRTESFPGTPYLKADQERRKWWRAILDQYPGKKIGIAWNGGIPITGRKKRSIPLEDFLTLKGNDTFVSLEHKDPGDVPMLNFSRFINTKDYDDTAALVSELDHVITVTTALVDLCGALGKPCDVFVPSKPHWRYGLKGDMPWYKSVKLFRQLEGEPWSKTLRRYASLHRL